jgi:3' terminal RNA ribose 2'-O-methyltransferase Hen1
MYLAITLRHDNATDLGYLLHKNPERLHAVELSFGTGYVAFPEVEPEVCTASVYVHVDPVGLVRNRKKSGGGDPYVNDRPYAANSYLSAALAKLFGTAMTGRSKEKQELADSKLDLQAHLPVLPCRGGEKLLRGLFEPLGYEVQALQRTLDEFFPDWGMSAYWDVRLRATVPLKDLLAHLYVLIPVLDDSKHYWVDRDEIEKLFRKGGDWLAAHPMKEEIAKRYLRRQHVLVHEALARLAESDETAEEFEVDPDEVPVEERGPSLHEQRLERTFDVLKESGAKSVLDLGCGEGRLLNKLIRHAAFNRVVGMDVSWVALEKAQRRLRLDRMPQRLADKLELLHGSLTYRDKRLEGFDAATVVEVIEHLEPHRLRAFERTVFEFARPSLVILTTPNREYNVLFEGFPDGQLRHGDHRFEWTRAEFEIWARRVAETHGYEVEIEGVGPEDPTHGSPSQLGVFKKCS